MSEFIGTVTGLEEINPYCFFVRVNSSYSSTVALDQVVRVDYRWGDREFHAYGMITEVKAKWDGTISTGYQEEAYNEGIYQGVPIYLGKVVVTRVLEKKEEDLVPVPYSFPPPAGEEVFVACGEELEVALGFSEIRKGKRALPCGILPSGDVAYLDLKYILGDNGAHINISGQSGVAAKTSYATFLLWMLMNYSRYVKDNAFSNQLVNSRSLVFNVKGESLLFLDYWNEEWKRAQKKDSEEGRQFAEWQEMFRLFEVEPHPFSELEVYVPPRNEKGSPHIHHSRPEVKAYGWDILDIVELGLLPLMFDPEELSQNPNFLLTVTVIEDFLRDQYDGLVADARRELRSGSYPVKIDLQGLTDQEIVRVYLQAAGEEPRLILESFSLPNNLISLITMLRLSLEGEGKLGEELQREQIDPRTTLAISRRLRAARRTGLNLLWRDITRLPYREVKEVPEGGYHLRWNRPGGISVVDISKLTYQGQAFVVGAVLREIMHWKERERLAEPVFVYLDELNKYAPRTGGGPLGNIFRDVAERGRSFRVVLIGAEQTASQVDYRVITQAATTVVGRQKLAELHKEEYAHLEGNLRDKAATLLPGEVIIDQPFLRIPLTVKFPLPPWATSEENREELYRKEVVFTPEEELKKLLGE